MAGTEKSSKAKWIVISLFLVGLIAAGMVAAAALSGSNRSGPQVLPKVNLPEAILAFAFQRLPEVYAGLARLNREILVIEVEMKRIGKIESEFPRQKNIVSAQQMTWKRVQNGLSTALARIEKDIETIYVSFLVNPEKGKVLIVKEGPPLAAAIQKALEASAPETQRLKSPPPLPPWARLKTRVFG